jgi:cytoskeletal protein CcmA (bactofilin family)
MSATPKRRLLDMVGAAPTFIAAGCRVTGDIETAGPVVVCGAVRGDGKIGAALSMARDSSWEGEIHAGHAVIAGSITGKLIIAIAKGAVVEGVMQVTSGQPIVKFEEKRGAS